MKRLLAIILAATLWINPSFAQQTNPGFITGQVPTAAQWNGYFAAKLDYNPAGLPISLGGTGATSAAGALTNLGALPLTGGSLSGELKTAASIAASSGFNLPPGTAPTSPANGDMWTTTLGLYVQVAGGTVGPLGTGSGGSGCTISGGSANQLLTNNGVSGCSSNANATANAGALTLGASGTLGSVTMGNATSGTVKLQPPTGALGTVILTLPGVTDMLAGLTATQQLTNKTYSGGVLTGTFTGNPTLSGNPTFSGAANLGTPASGVGTNFTGIPISTALLAGALPNSTSATTQTTSDSSTDIATDAFVHAVVTAFQAAANTWSALQTFTAHVVMSGLQTTGTIAGAICTDSSGDIIKNAGANCYAGGGSTFQVVIPLDTAFGSVGDGSTDNCASSSAGFWKARTAALAINSTAPGVSIVFSLTSPTSLNPTPLYLCSNPLIWSGINNLIVEGNGAEILNTTSDPNAVETTWFIGGPGIISYASANYTALGYSVNDTPYLIATASFAATSVTMVTHAQAANFTVGHWAMIGSQVSNTAWPPALRYFDYVKVLTTNTSTGVVTFDRPLKYTHYSTLPANFIANGSTYPSAATMTDMGAYFNAKQFYHNVNFLSSLNTSPPGNDWLQFEGSEARVEGGSTGGGVTPTNLVIGSLDNMSIVGISGGDGFEIDKLVDNFKFSNCTIASTFSTDSASINNLEMDHCITSGTFIYEGAQNIRFTNSTFGSVIFGNAAELVGTFENDSAGSVQVYPTNSAGGYGILDVDGTTVTFNASTGVITIPYSSINQSSPNANCYFLFNTHIGSVLDVAYTNAGFVSTTGGNAVITNITDDSTNVYVTIQLTSLTVTGATVVGGGTGFGASDTIPLANGAILTVATRSGTAVATVTVSQPYATLQQVSAVAQNGASSGGGTGATFNLTYGLPNGSILMPNPILAYHGAANVNGNAGGFTASDQGGRVLTGFPNGGTAEAIGNHRYALISPISGVAYLNNLQVSRGRLKSITVNVLKPYTGTEFSVNTVFLNFAELFPVYNGFLFQVNLSIPGQRQITPSGVTGMQTDDVLAGSSAIPGAFYIQIGHNNNSTAFTDPTSQLPVIEIDEQFEDVAHGTPYSQ
jgi:hypothetical protein